MSLKINISGWKTAPSGTNLCLSCRHATVIQGHTEASLSVQCNAIDRPMKEKVVECSSYSNRALPTLNAMYEMAYIIENKKGGGIGFLRATQFREKYGYNSLED